jgi:hypothetical protein
MARKLMVVKILFLLLTTSALTSCNSQQQTYLKNGKLLYDLVLKEQQEGTGGTSVRTWTLGTNNKWVHTTSFINLENITRQVDRKDGDLPSGWTIKIEKILSSQQIFKLPEFIGSEPKINPHTYNLSFGDNTCTLFGIPPKRKKDDNTKEHIIKWSLKNNTKEGERFAIIAQHIINICESN